MQCMTVCGIDATTWSESHSDHSAKAPLSQRAPWSVNMKASSVDRRWTLVAVRWETINACHCLWKHRCTQSSEFVPHVVVNTSALYKWKDN